MQDLVSVGAVLALIGAAQLSASPLIESLPCKMKSLAWIGYGGTFATSVYLVLRLLNGARARQLAGAMFGDGLDGWLGSALPGLFFALGAAGSMLCTPQGAG